MGDRPEAAPNVVRRPVGVSITAVRFLILAALPLALGAFALWEMVRVLAGTSADFPTDTRLSDVILLGLLGIALCGTTVVMGTISVAFWKLRLLGCLATTALAVLALIGVAKGLLSHPRLAIPAGIVCVSVISCLHWVTFRDQFALA